MNSPIRLSFLPLTLVFLLYLNVGAQNFEGKIISKNISINLFALDEFIYGNEEYEGDLYEENYDEGETDFNESQIPMEIIEKYFALSINEIKQAVDKYKSEFGDDYIEAPFYTETISEILIKGTKMRTDSEEGEEQISFIMDMNDPIARMIRWDQKVVINMNLEKMKEQNQAALEQYGNTNDIIKNEDESSYEFSGEKKEINGMLCELYKGTDSYNNYQHIWMTKDVDEGLVNSFINMTELFSTIETEDTGESDLEFFVKHKSMPILTKTLYGAELLEIEEIVKIQKTKISDSKFEIPKGFKEMDFSEMMQQGFE